jgi:hypothetical protein
MYKDDPREELKYSNRRSKDVFVINKATNNTISLADLPKTNAIAHSTI